jgi:small conductance mechanosensitive channel
VAVAQDAPDQSEKSENSPSESAPDLVVEEDSGKAPEESPKQSDLDHDRETLTRLDELQESLRQLEATEPAEGEERNILRLEAQKILEEMRDHSSRIANRIAKLDSTSAFADSARTILADHLTYLARFYSRGYDNLRDRLTSMHNQRANVPPGELADYETLVGTERKLLDLVMSWSLDNAKLCETVGLDADRFWRKYDLELEERAASLTGRLQVSDLERDRIRSQIRAATKTGATEDELAGLRVRLQASDQRIDGLVTSLRKAASLLGNRGYETSEYQQIIIQATGEVTEQILDPKVLLGLLKDFWRDVLQWFRENGPTILVKILILIVCVLVAHIILRVAWWLTLLIHRRKTTKLVQDLTTRLIKPLATVIGLIAGLWFLGVNPLTLMAGLGVVGVIVGLALQESLGNLAAGAFILFNRPYDVDDTVRVGGVLGTVRQMGLATTTIVTFDNRRLHVPNRKIWNEVIENRTSEHCRRVETTVRITYEEDIDTAMELISAALAEHELVLKSPEPVIFVSKLDDSWVELAVRPWTKTDDWWEMTMRIPKVLRTKLEAAGIRAPYPRREVELASSSDKKLQGGSRQESGEDNIS